jgi:hypothetical protein
MGLLPPKKYFAFAKWLKFKYLRHESFYLKNAATKKYSALLTKRDNRPRQR